MLPRILAFPLLCIVAGACLAGDGAAALRARHAELQAALASNPFHRPLHLVSNESADGVSGTIYAVIGQPFSTAAPALERPAGWCDIFLLHLNTKQCLALAGAQNATLQVAVGSKHAQAAGDAYRLDFAFGVTARSPDYLQVALSAAKGPLSTSNYRLVLDATPLDADRTFIRLAYSYAFGTAGRLAMQVYLGTAGSGKVGFTILGTRPDGQPQYVEGMRGVVERNTMRYYLAIESHLGALSSPPQARTDKSLRDWFAATERYPRQLREIGETEYLDMKRREFQRRS